MYGQCAIADCNRVENTCMLQSNVPVCTLGDLWSGTVLYITVHNITYSPPLIAAAAFQAWLDHRAFTLVVAAIAGQCLEIHSLHSQCSKMELQLSRTFLHIHDYILLWLVHWKQHFKVKCCCVYFLPVYISFLPLARNPSYIFLFPFSLCIYC